MPVNFSKTTNAKTTAAMPAPPSSLDLARVSPRLHRPCADRTKARCAQSAGLRRPARDGTILGHVSGRPAGRAPARAADAGQTASHRGFGQGEERLWRALGNGLSLDQQTRLEGLRFLLGGTRNSPLDRLRTGPVVASSRTMTLALMRLRAVRELGIRLPATTRLRPRGWLPWPGSPAPPRPARSASASAAPTAKLVA